MDDADRRYICQMCCDARQRGNVLVSAGRGNVRCDRHAAGPCRTASTESICAHISFVCRVFHFNRNDIIQTMDGQQQFHRQAIFSNRRLDGDIKLKGIFAMPIPNAPLPGVRSILQIALQVATGFLMTLAAAFLLLQIEINFGLPTSANPLF